MPDIYLAARKKSKKKNPNITGYTKTIPDLESIFRKNRDWKNIQAKNAYPVLTPP